MNLDGLLIALAWIVSDFIGGPLVGLIVGGVAGLILLVVRWVRSRNFPLELLVDTLVVVALSALGIVIQNTSLALFSPLLLDLLLLYSLLFLRRSASIGSDAASLPAFLRRRINPEFMRASMLIMLQPLILALVAHAVLVLVAGLIFYFLPQLVDQQGYLEEESTITLIAALLAAYVFALRDMRRWARCSPEDRELLALVDSRGRLRGASFRYQVHGPRGGQRHAVVRLVLRDQLGRILLQKRAAKKTTNPGLWDTAVAGHVLAGETLEQAVGRESAEEIGLRIDLLAGTEPTAIMQSGERDREHAWIFESTLVPGNTLRPNPDEVETLRFWPIPDLVQAMTDSPQLFTPTLVQELSLLGIAKEKS